MRFFLAILLCATCAFSQMVISVDESVSKNSEKSLLVALGASALLPGMGELYLDEREMVRPFMWTDVALWMVAVGSYYVGERYISSAHDYAVRHAGLNTSSKKVSLLNTVGDYRSRSGVAGQNSSPDMDEDYNQSIFALERRQMRSFPMISSGTGGAVIIPRHRITSMSIRTACAIIALVGLFFRCRWGRWC